MNKEQPKRVYKTKLTEAQKRVFATEVAKGSTGVQAIDRAIGNTRIMQQASKRVLASRLLTDDNIRTSVELVKQKLDEAAKLAVNRLPELINSDNEQVATANVWRTIEQTQGKATQRIEQKSQHVNISIDLTED